MTNLKCYNVYLNNTMLFCGSYGACQAFIEAVKNEPDGEYFNLPAADAAYGCEIKEFNPEEN